MMDSANHNQQKRSDLEDALNAPAMWSGLATMMLIAVAAAMVCGAMLWDATRNVARPLTLEKIDLNSAPVGSLVRLEGIGPARAEAIIAARPFRQPRDVLAVKGIGEKTLQKILPHIRCGTDEPPAAETDRPIDVSEQIKE